MENELSMWNILWLSWQTEEVENYYRTSIFLSVVPQLGM